MMYRLGFPRMHDWLQEISRWRDISTSVPDIESLSTDSTTLVSTIESSGSAEGDISIRNTPATTESDLATTTSSAADSNSNSSSDDEDNKSSSTPIGAIVGGVIGGVAFFAILGFGIWLCIRRKKRSDSVGTSHEDPNAHSSANYHSPSQPLPHYDNTTPRHNDPPMSSISDNASENFSNLPYVASPEVSEPVSTTDRPETSCPYLDEKHTSPWLIGCPNNDFCPSWLGNLFRRLGDGSNKGTEIKKLRHLAAQEKYSGWKEIFAREYFTKKPIPPRQKPDRFWHMVSQDTHSDVASVSSFVVASSTTEEETSQNTSEAALNFGDQWNSLGTIANANDQSIVKNDSAPETSDIDPEDLFRGDIIKTGSEQDFKSNSEEPEENSSRVKYIGEEYQDLVAPIWSCFYPFMDMSREGEFLD
ncbi:hypothetical protein FLONG3_5947 [Fusarium longipes]|uniref:Uncharacterized protein n=1 Tax=Fusarium longipes TaxID=694270 RepID=A0A395SSA2_9HYPO|nr:hypothetical protein FLONG3_5947 [Fusarium longipes]